MPEGVKETIVLKAAGAIPTLRFSVDLGELLLRGDGDGGLEVYDPVSGEVRFVLSRPYLEDANGEIGGAEYVVRAPVTGGALDSGQGPRVEASPRRRGAARFLKSSPTCPGWPIRRGSTR